LNKLLFSKLYETTPTVTKRGDREEPVGTIIFDPDGEYFWPDDKGRPGLCDVPHLQDKLVVFTARSAPSPFYGSFTAGGIKLDIRQLRPSDVISIALPPERQDQQNVAKLRALSPERWRQLVDLIDRDRGGADLDEIAKIMNLDASRQEAEAVAARSNMTNVVGMLHDRSSQFMGLLMKALEAGKICVVDVSQMRGTQSLYSCRDHSSPDIRSQSGGVHQGGTADHTRDRGDRRGAGGAERTCRSGRALYRLGQGRPEV